MRDQRFVFGEVAADYDRWRPSFPARLVADLVRTAGLDATSRVVEVGAGTGKLTVLVAATGCEIAAIEPTPAMAAVLARNVESFPAVSIVEATFEEAEIDPASVDALLAAQSWHWVDEGVRVSKAAEVLRPGGTLALIWNVADVDAYDYHDEIDAVYRAHAPHMAHGSTTTGWQPQDDPTAPIEASGAFSAVRCDVYPWRRTLRTEEYVGVLATHSHHRMLDPDVRARVFDEIAAIVDAHDGVIEECYVARCFTARRV